MKYSKCPVCGDGTLSDMWRRGRKLRQECRYCDWVGRERNPEQREITATRRVPAGHHGGHTFELFDRYGHTLISSRSYSTPEEAETALRRELAHARKDADPCTGVLWPSTVTVTGTIIR